MKKIAGLFCLFLITSCGSMLDIAGKGAKTKCLYLDTDSLKIVQSCDDRLIFRINVSERSNAKDYNGKLIFSEDLKIFSDKFVLPFNCDSLDKKFLEISIQLTDTHFREIWYINTKPGDLKKKKKISSRYFGH
ncbi:MAG: hypothetical protein IAF38_04680 [Bacteroidia bacterium]|nr:hypothetical protein [Bacteroidia bacterium]